MKKILQVLNGVALIATIFMNYISNTGLMNDTTIGEISGGLRTFFTPVFKLVIIDLKELG